MPDTIKERPAHQQGLAKQFIVPIAAILGIAVGLVVATVIWTSEDIDTFAKEQQRQRFMVGLNAEKSERADQIASLTISEEAWSASQSEQKISRLRTIISKRALDYFGFEDVYIVNRENHLIIGTSHGEALTEREFLQKSNLVLPLVQELQARIDTIVQNAAQDQKILSPNELPKSMLIHDGKQTYFVAAAPIAPASLEGANSWLLAVALKRVDMLWLQNFGAQQGTPYLQITDTLNNRNQIYIDIPRADKTGSIYLAWDPYLPGVAMRDRLIPVAVLVFLTAIVFSGIIFLRVQKIEKDLINSEERARQLVGQDHLSGLPNRMLFSTRLDKELARLQRDGPGLAVMFLDLDRFKDVNDTHGHQAGDELIKEVANRLSGLLRLNDTLARFGGDEFAIIQTNVKRAMDAEGLARRILNSLTEPFEIAGTQVSVGVSIGIALSPENGNERQSLMQLADTALYQSKNDGRNRYSFFESQMNDTLRMRKLVEDELRQAINTNGLLLYYQPQMSSDGLTVLGLEALVRWPHPTKGMIAPTQFVAVAEERGLIVPLGEWVLRQACIDGKRWPNLRIAVNVSPIQFRHKDFVDNVKRILDETGFDPSRLEIELTEGVVVEDADAAEWAMMELKAIGVHLALDDFGTGYSSLIYLRRFAFDKIKIDRSFLESMEATGESAILVHSIVHLGRALGLTVTAEGVETDEQHRFLQAVGCHELQGYLFSPPVPAADIDKRLHPQTSAFQLAANG